VLSRSIDESIASSGLVDKPDIQADPTIPDEMSTPN
jgi:hypothetical protein